MNALLVLAASEDTIDGPIDTWPEAYAFSVLVLGGCFALWLVMKYMF